MRERERETTRDEPISSAYPAVIPQSSSSLSVLDKNSTLTVPLVPSPGPRQIRSDRLDDPNIIGPTIESYLQYPISVARGAVYRRANMIGRGRFRDRASVPHPPSPVPAALLPPLSVVHLIIIIPAVIVVASSPPGTIRIAIGRQLQHAYVSRVEIHPKHAPGAPARYAVQVSVTYHPPEPLVPPETMSCR